jgi:phenylacetate-CoA ligase
VLQLRRASHSTKRLWDRHVSVDVFPAEPGTSRFNRVTRENRVCVDFLDVSAAARQLFAAAPASISGPGHLLIELGEALGDRCVRPRQVGTHSETLTPEHRAALKAAFGVDPQDTYGTSECGVVAWQCKEADLYHVNHESVIVEIVDDDGGYPPPGELGQLVLTSMWNDLTPFVRYRIGDSAAWASRPCRCGYAQPAITQIVGRTPDWLIDATGRRVSPSHLWLSVHLGIDALPRVRRYCVRQDLNRHVVVEIVPDHGFTADDARQAQESYRKVLGDVGIDVRLVDAITAEVGRKFETISSAAGRASEVRTR